jgi:hypothetical protein
MDEVLSTRTLARGAAYTHSGLLRIHEVSVRYSPSPMPTNWTKGHPGLEFIPGSREQEEETLGPGVPLSSEFAEHELKKVILSIFRGRIPLVILFVL